MTKSMIIISYFIFGINVDGAIIPSLHCIVELKISDQV